MKITNIKPIPKYILNNIHKKDKELHPQQDGHTRYYAYLTIWSKELIKVTVAVKCHNGKWFCKQVAVHGFNSNFCFFKDIYFTYMAGYITSFYPEGIDKRPKDCEGDWSTYHKAFFDPYAPLVNLSIIEKFPEFKYSAYDLYNNVDILQYLDLYLEYPQTEYLLKLGFINKIVTSKKILQLTDTDKTFRKWIARNREIINKKKCDVSLILRAYKLNKPLNELYDTYNFEKTLHKNPNYKLFKELFHNNFKSLRLYLKKQNAHVYMYADYINACRHLGIDLTQNKNLIPHDFMRWHDIRTNEYKTAKALKDAEEKRQLYEKFSSVAHKYVTMQHNSNNAFICIIAKSPADLIHEGETLHHCVGGMNYSQKFIKEETLIFFIRNKLEPEKPFITLEYSPSKKSILQCHTHNNGSPDEKSSQYINKIWLPFANKQLKQIAA